jgi:hypothetical protein
MLNVDTFGPDDGIDALFHVWIALYTLCIAGIDASGNDREQDSGGYPGAE